MSAAACTPELVARAFEIADEAMFEMLTCKCIPIDTNQGLDATAWAMCDEASGEVKTLALASEAIREAYEWLSKRGFVHLVKDDAGEYVTVLRRPGE